MTSHNPIGIHILLQGQLYLSLLLDGMYSHSHNYYKLHAQCLKISSLVLGLKDHDEFAVQCSISLETEPFQCVFIAAEIHANMEA
jgi:hypothetical protein